MTTQNFDCLTEMSKKMRIRILELGMISGKNGAHIGGGLSCTDIISTLYGAVLKFDVNNPLDKNRDRFILSKGHAAIALFSALEIVGFIKKEDLDQFEMNGSPYYAHAARNLSKGIEFSGGSLSLGLSFAVGVALSNRRDGLSNHIYVLVGDGECDEGLVWESLMSAAHYKLSNLTVIVDCNGIQSDGFTSDVMDHHSLAEKFQAFGFNVHNINGHDVKSLYQSLIAKDSNKPNAIIANTAKGKGVSFMENNKIWHHGVLSIAQYEQAISEQK